MNALVGVRDYFRSIWRLRYFWSALVRIDLRNRYRRSMIGVGWSLLHPIMMTIVLSTVFGTILQADVWTYAPFLLTGLTFWNFVGGTANQGCMCFFAGESYIRQHPAPLAIYPLRTVLGAGVHFLIGLVVVLVFVWCVHGFGNLAALPALVPALLLIFILGWSVALCAGVTNVLFQDCQHLVEVLLQVLFYMTPLMYPADLLRQRGLGWWVDINPLAAVLELLRAPILRGEYPPLSSLGVAAGAALLFSAAAALLMSRMERRMVFYL